MNDILSLCSAGLWGERVSLWVQPLVLLLATVGENRFKDVLPLCLIHYLWRTDESLSVGLILYTQVRPQNYIALIKETKTESLQKHRKKRVSILQRLI